MSESRRQSVSFTAMPPGVLVNDSRANSTDDIQIALAPHIQTYLSQTGRRHSCCSVMLPVAFERAAAKSWLDPKFDSPVLEEQFQASVFPHIRMRYRFTLSYILLCSVVWCLYFVIDGGSEDFWRPISTSFSMMSLVTIMAMCFTHWDLYKHHRTLTSALTALILCSASLAFLTYTGRAFSPLGHFAICLEIVLLIYTALPMPLWLGASIAICYSIAFELVSHMVIGVSAVHGATTTTVEGATAATIAEGSTSDPSHKILMLRIMAHLSVHLVGVHVLIMNLVRMRGTFMKVGQNLLVRRQLEMEKQLKEKMIHSVMPPKVADMLLNEGGSGGLDPNQPPESHYMRPRASHDVKSLFRPFHMHSMENVSILFADIVGFTRMSSTKTAEQLVEILNDLFERFDDLCTLSGCEKISTLGDCYYCVSGCPEPRADHAICCVEMGLGMIDAMRCFDAQRHEGVKMRVGVHTGTVLCGIVGTRRVKFDVWSNDVSLANKMESSGKPEQVHISQETSSFLGDAYYLEEGEEVYGHRTYFVVGRRRDVSRANSLSPSMAATATGGSSLLLPGAHGAFASLSQSATNISVVQPHVPPASPVGQLSNSLKSSPVLSMRPRLTSLSMKLRKKSQSQTQSQTQQSRDRDLERGIIHPAASGIPPVIVVRERPKIIITTKSLPGSLDSDEQPPSAGAPTATTIAMEQEQGTTAGQQELCSKLKLKMWKMPRFLKLSARNKEKEKDKLSSDKLDRDKDKEQPTTRIHSNSLAAPGDECLAFIESSTPSPSPVANGCSGYQQLPVLVETSCNTRLSSNQMLDIPNARPVLHHAATSTALSSSVMRSPDGGAAGGGGSCCSPGQYSMYDDIIDVRSYISQSRSDISPFGRTGSYRSQCGRQSSSAAAAGGGGGGVAAPSAASQSMEQSPLPRPRASTLTTGRGMNTEPSSSNCTANANAQANNSANTCCLPAPGNAGGGTHSHSRNSSIWPDGLSICPSATSRKDSGIKSNSRRSSIQQQIYALNQSAISQHRVSGYFTSSTSSISNLGEPGALPCPLPPPVAALGQQQPADPLSACLQQLRKQSDLQLIRCVRDNARSQRSYLVKPPLRRFSLYFKSRQLERDFRSKAHRFGSEHETEGPPTLATPRYNTYIDIFVGIAVYLCISVSLFLMTQNTVTPSFRLWVTLFSCFTAIQVFALFLFTRQMCRRHGTRLRSKSTVSEHLTGNNNGSESTTPQPTTGNQLPPELQHQQSRQSRRQSRQSQQFESCADRIFEAISSWYPWHICLAVLMAMPVVLIIANFLLLDLTQLEAFEYHYGFLIFVCIVHFCNFTQLNCWMRNILAFLAALCFIGIAVSQLTVYSSRSEIEPEAGNLNADANRSAASAFIFEEIKWFHDYHVEIYLDLLLILVLVWLLNREFEIGYRLTFYGNAVANQDKVRVQNMKNQADMLLHNIIPKHVAEHLKNTAKYSENHRNIAIIFASIVNFNEMYDESYLGGKEFLRVLNELIGDFDELLSHPKFRAVEKIKTIGSTFMAASGLDPSHRGTGDEHIHTLMEFAIEMQKVVIEFNKDLLEFNLILRIGMNIGDVTAGVIGTSKLYYDIWGDAVNVASRMDSTGVRDRIQVGKDCLPFLEANYKFEPRGSVYVKGKDHMEVFLYTGRRTQLEEQPLMDQLDEQLVESQESTELNAEVEQELQNVAVELNHLEAEHVEEEATNKDEDEEEEEEDGDLHSSETTTLFKSQESLHAAHTANGGSHFNAANTTET
ncbi:adenylate cyclase type 9 isoform X1 [Drosophila albomicans]|uniref:Adenylate cyclase type 9 n=2 Tax=Drosophila albomicans TaxID=7291 RepID=A0A6P8XNS9_DROAB|nr:adenylate cyclase type 9 isoform X1 [Drosophila albomicans]XP_034114623.1 adenylate cyclase type 9 isoform X1 [Drosophila albomicans]XP_034114704.1 adenylate cyclase type 9 isoform X1 [Drosophila albomicans]XP_051864762.1 adenylate cyclase type 9 isoform X1 [Drosophila albomicans]